jgi:hypothetical protein
MFWNNHTVVSHRWKCKVDGCDFVCDDYFTLQQHTGRKHPGFKLHCKVDGCDFTTREYRALERHMSWKHPQILAN